MRQFLIEQQGFSPSALYMHLTSTILSCKELSSYLDRHNVLYTAQELSAILADDLPYNQFLDLILPSSMSSLRQIKINSNPKSQQPITEAIDCAFRALLQQELHIVRESQAIKDELSTRWDFSVDACYQVMIDKSSKYIDHLHLKKFFHQLNIPVTEDDLLYLLRRIDIDRDGRVSKTDLQAVLEGKKQ